MHLSLVSPRPEIAQSLPVVQVATVADRTPAEAHEVGELMIAYLIGLVVFWWLFLSLQWSEAK